MTDDWVYCEHCGNLIDSSSRGCPCQRDVDKERTVAHGLLDDAVAELVRAQLRLRDAFGDDDPLSRRVTTAVALVADIRDSIDP